MALLSSPVVVIFTSINVDFIWQFPGLEGAQVGRKQTANSVNLHVLYEELTKILNQEIHVDPLLIVVALIPSSCGICTQTLLFVHRQLEFLIIVEIACVDVTRKKY